MAGLSTTGLTIKTQPEILQGINDDQKAAPALGAEWDTSTTSPQGVLNDIVSAALGEAWQVISAVYTQGYPDGAEGIQLDRVAEYTGAVRLAAEPSTVEVVCVGTNGTSLTAGRVVSVPGAVTGEQRFESTEAATIATVASWASSTAYALYDLRQADSGKLYVCTQAGTSAGSGGPTGTGSTEITDGTAKWKYVATATAGVVVSFESQDTGAIIANAGTLTQIETSVGGWSAAFNPFDADLGRDRELDADFRARRSALLRLQGKASIDAIRADVLDVDDVTSCTVFENEGDVTNGDGMPPHSIEVLVEGGTEQGIVDAILGSKAAGTQTYGNDSGTATDSSGTDRTIYYSRPTSVPIYMTIDVTVLGDEWPSDGEDQIKEAVVAFGDSLQTSDDVVRSQFFAPADVQGVYDVTDIRLGFTASPSGTANLSIASRERATFDTSRVVVNVTTI